MKYKITTNYCWFRGGSMIVKMYYINGMPFTFDELPDGHLRDHDLIKEADKQRTFARSSELKRQKQSGTLFDKTGDFHDRADND